MSPLSPKRRKLDHNTGIPGSLNESYGKDEDGVGQFSSDEDVSLRNGGLVKERKPRSKRVHTTDESALYTGGMYKSSMFKLQIDEMLTEVKPNYEKRLSGVDEALHRLNSIIGAIEERDPLPIADATRLLHKSHKIAIPFPDPNPAKDAAYKLAYAPPSKVNVVGSYALKTMTKSETTLSVDMVVVMPDSIFQEKDFLNYRYFYKRAYYLACLATGIQENAHGEFTLKFDNLNGNNLHPVLVAVPKSERKKPEFEIRILPALSTKLFPESKLRPTNNSIRVKHEIGGGPLQQGGPSPFYNASVRSDGNFEPYLQLLHSASKQSAGFKDACILGRIWLRQREFDSNIVKGGFGHFEWAALSALLLKGGGPKGNNILSPGYNCYQMFRAVLQFLSTTDLASKPQSYEFPEFIPTKSDVPMFYDGPRGQNILYKMSPWSYALLREEAKTSLDMLDDSTFDRFESIFILRSPTPLHRFDCLIRVDTSHQQGSAYSCDHRPYRIDFSTRLYHVLREGLTDRVKSIGIKLSELQPWSIKSSSQVVPGENSLLVSVTFNPSNIDRLVDHGPSADEKKKAAKFQKFWGEKAELRRFKDGSILESLVWSPGSTYSIFQEICTYLIKRHFETEVCQSLKFTGERFESLLPGSGPSVKGFEALKQAFDTFEKNIRDLESLPLQLRQLSPVGTQLRYSTIDAPTFSPRTPLKVPADVLIQFEGSGRWPDDIAAIQRTKIAFLLEIGTLLQKADDSTHTRLGLENGDQHLQNCAFLDVIYQSGATFRLRIHNEREQTLLERQIKDKSTDHLTREEAVLALSIYKQHCCQLPLHTQSIATHCTRFPLLSPTIRLMKLWADSHMISGHLSEEFIEMLVAHTFLQPFPWPAPSSAMTGFLRTLLFVSRWDWRTTPLVVDFNGTMTGKDVASIDTRLEAWRKIDPAMNKTVVLAASNHDMSGTGFTDKGPSRMVAARLTALARSACKVVKDQGVDLNPKSLFSSSTSDYDFVIHLTPNFVEADGKKGSTKKKFKNLEVQSKLSLESMGYRPIRLFLDELEKFYSNSAIFFYDATNGSVIGALWNPQVTSARQFKVNLPFSTTLATDSNTEDEIKLDKNAILAEIARLGADMVSRIEVTQ